MTALAFVPIGQLCGRLMKRRPNLRAYGLNLLGSLVGVALTFIVSFLWTPPLVWFGLVVRGDPAAATCAGAMSFGVAGAASPSSR